MKITTLVASILMSVLLEPVIASFIDTGKDTSAYNRPLIHLTPNVGWLNDPNGLFYDKKTSVWHAYYQYNPNDTIWGQPLYWGHSSSKDLTHWEEHQVALGPQNDDEGIFSGSIVIDYNNTSGFFDESIDKDQRVVAIYTNSIPDTQTQDIAYSLDGGETFTKYKKNPVIDVNSTQFRDPKVFWHEETNKWIMVVLKSQEYKIQIFGSLDLKTWDLHSNFTSGYLGNQYECPGLIKVPIENTNDYKWVMFLAINPGSPAGGSSNQYFIGEFDGFEFKQDDSITRVMDAGKDFYAFQTFSDNEQDVIGLAWASNWQYANVVPTNLWRSSMSLARKYTLGYVNQNVETKIMTLIQTPILNNLDVINKVEKNNHLLTKNDSVITNFSSSTGLLDFNTTFKVVGESIDSNSLSNIEILIHSQMSNSSTESIKVGFDRSVSAFYFNRDIPNVEFNNNPYFTNKFSTYVEPSHYDEDDMPVYKIYGIVDKNILELYFNDGTQTMTNTFFMSEDKYPHQIEIASNVDGQFELQSLLIRELNN